MRAALWVLGLGPWVLGDGDFGIVVEAGAPDALCPAIELTREAVRARIGRIEVAEGGHWSALYTIVHSPGTDRGDRIRLELRDPSAELKLLRELPIAGETCATLAQIIALVIERYFRDLSAAAPAPETVSEAAAETPPHAAASEVAGERVVPPATSEAPRTRRPPYVLGLFNGVSSVSTTAGVGGTAAIRLGDPTRLRLSALLPFGSYEERLGQGTLALAEYPLRLAFSGVLGSGPVDFELGPEVLIAFERGSASNLNAARSGWRVVTGLGLQGAATYWISPRFGIEVGFSADAVASEWARVFSVAGDEVLKPEELRGVVRVGIDFAVLP